MYLHDNKEMFKSIIEQTAEYSGKSVFVVEKDYYVTLILKCLSEQLDNCVFKGGTSLSKGFHVIDRFSEDIDITFNEHIGEKRRKKLKNTTLKGISENLRLQISNWQDTQSDRDYNAYLFSYESVFGFEDDRLPQHVKLETALGSYSFPTQKIEIGNYIVDYLESRGRESIADQYGLERFYMNVQSLERTFIDKVFALCDYYLLGKSKRYSRHLYDVYMLNSLMDFNNEFIQLVEEVRIHREKIPYCISAKKSIDVNEIILKFCDDDFYKDDYQEITSYFVTNHVTYEEVINTMREIVTRRIF